MTTRALPGVFVWLIAGILVYYAYRRTRSILPSLVQFPVLIASWYFMFGYFTLTTQRVLAPWDQWGQFAPPPGTWERSLNDFFKNPSHAYLVGACMVGISVLIFSIRLLRRKGAWADLPFVFIATNFSFLLLALFLIPLMTNLPDLWLSQPRPAVDIGYHRTWIDGLMTIMLTVALYWLQAKQSTKG